MVGLAGDLPDRGLVALPQEAMPVPPAIEAGLVAPVIVRAAELEALLHPYDFLVDGDADCRESGQEGGTGDGGVPDVPGGIIGDVGQRRGEGVGEKRLELRGVEVVVLDNSVDDAPAVLPAVSIAVVAHPVGRIGRHQVGGGVGHEKRYCLSVRAVPAQQTVPAQLPEFTRLHAGGALLLLRLRHRLVSVEGLFAALLLIGVKAKQQLT